jgi:hypothetical protein
VSTQPISDKRLADAYAKADKLLAGGHHAACSSQDGRECDCYRSTKLEYVLAAALVAVRAERDQLDETVREMLDLSTRWGGAKITDARRLDRITEIGNAGLAAVSSPGEDGSVLRCSLAAIHSPHCWAMYGDDDSPWYRCPGEETP